MNLRHALVVPCLPALSPQVHAVDVVRPLDDLESPESREFEPVPAAGAGLLLAAGLIAVAHGRRRSASSRSDVATP